MTFPPSRCESPARLSRSRPDRLVVLCLLVLLGTAAQACAPASTPTPTASPVPPLPTATPTLEVPSALLVVRDGNSLFDQELADEVARLAEQDTLALVRATKLDPGSLGDATRRVVLDAGDPDLSSLAAAAPGIVMVAVHPGGAERFTGSAPAPGSEFELRRAFAAGYAVSLLAPEWRIAAILPAEPGEAASAFAQGGTFGCGLCNPPYPPFAEYPLVEVSQSEADTLRALDALAELSSVSALYLGPGLATPEVVQAARARGLLLIGADLPPEGSAGTWAASIRPDLPAALRQVWAADADAPASAVAPLRLEQVDPELLSPGRQEDVERLFAKLESGSVRVLRLEP